MAAKTIFWCRAITLIYANWRENDGVALFIYFFIFCVKRSVFDRQWEKITVKKAQAKVVKCAKNKTNLGSLGPPFGHIRVKVAVTLR